MQAPSYPDVKCVNISLFNRSSATVPMFS